jgi:hypothetical protein
VAVHDEWEARFILHGGYAPQVSTSTPSGQTLALDDALTAFTVVASNGPPRSEHCMAYDLVLHQTILFGGLDNAELKPCQGGSSITCGSTWLFDDMGWRKLNPKHTPSPRRNAQMVYDDGHQLMILFGGEDDLGHLLGDTWAWDGTDWSPVSSPPSPPARRVPLMTYDPQRDQVVLFGGYSTVGLYDTWELGP